MLDSIKIKNFKMFNKSELNLTNLNLLMGEESNGINSFFQLFLTLRQTFMKKNNSKELIIDGVFTNLGELSEVLNENSPSPLITVELLDSFNNLTKLYYQLDYPHDKFSILRARPSINEARLNALFSAPFYYISKDRIIANDNVLSINQYAYDNCRVSDNIEISSPLVRNPFDDSMLLKEQLTTWLKDILIDNGLTVNNIPSSQKYLHALSLCHILLTAPKGSIILLENPEVLLENRGQLELGFLISIAATSGLQLFCETHSENILCSVSRAIKEGKLHHRDVVLDYFKNKDGHESSILSIPFNDDGELRENPFMVKMN